ncbi:helix-turn-helix transcriptional regulator [Amycolatopsis sp. NPDC049253]|uniref:PadR family transcriptional regulator n=1 Tax=Amycolatopsis sp. NPDC049253 TaxID=3155274 RepID=UPI00342D51B9
MPKNALDNPLVLPILGLLVEQPRHAYAVFSEVRSRYGYLEVRNATVYTLLDRLTAEGWVATTGGAERDVLAVTDDGVAALAERVRKQLGADLTGGPPFVTALAYLGILPPSEAQAVLRERIELVRGEIEGLETATREAATLEVHMIEAYYLLSRLRHDIEWLGRTADRIGDGELAWPQ